MAFDKSSLYASYLSQNVISKKLRQRLDYKGTPSSYSTELRHCHVAFDPDSVQPHEVTGGFNSVVEMSASYCADYFLQTINYIVDEPVSVDIYAEDLQTFLRSQDVSFDSQYLRSFDSSEIENGVCQLRLTPSFRGIHLEDPHRITAKFRLELQLFEVVEVKTLIRPAAVQEGSRVRPHEPSPVADEVVTVFRFNSPASAQGIYFKRSVDYKLLDTFGFVTLTLSCDYYIESNSRLARAQVFTDLTSAQLDFDPNCSDASTIYQQYLSDIEESWERRLLSRSKAALTPEVSLVGENPANQPVSEFPEFAVECFHIAADECQALAIAFTVSPAGLGAESDVRHFIGNSDYGVISDGYVVERVLMHKWRLGGFYRETRVSVPMQVQRDSHLEDATLGGTLKLTSLNAAEIDVDPDLRDDVIRLSGTGEVVPEVIRLADGTEVAASEADIGDTEEFSWQISTLPIESARYSDNAQTAEFQRKASADGYMHLARPFAMYYVQSSFEIAYCRIEAISSHFFVLGNNQ